MWTGQTSTMLANSSCLRSMLRLIRAPQSVPAPGPMEALVRVEACGVCGSDVFLQKGGFGSDKFPVVPGHEAAGRVVAVGDDGDEHWIGTQVALYYIAGPTDSSWYLKGLENLGPDIRRMGVDVDGAFADYVVRPLHTLVPITPEMDPTQVAVSTDALATPFHALTRIARLQPGETLAVIGPGGIGSNAVQIGKHLGADVIAIGRSEAKLELAGRLGADALVHASEGAAAVAGAGSPPDVVLQCAGTPGDGSIRDRHRRIPVAGGHGRHLSREFRPRRPRARLA